MMSFIMRVAYSDVIQSDGVIDSLGLTLSRRGPGTYRLICRPHGRQRSIVTSNYCFARPYSNKVHYSA